MNQKTKKIVLTAGILLLILTGSLIFACVRLNRTMIRITLASGSSHAVIRSGGREIFSRTAEKGGWQLCGAEITDNRLTLQITPPETDKQQIIFELPEIRNKLIDLRGEGKKRFLVLANVIRAHVPEQAVFYFFDMEDDFAFYGTREYIGELGATFRYPNPNLTFNSYAETGYWENAGGSFITIRNQLAKGGNQYISAGKADFKQLYLKYRALKQELEKRGGSSRVTERLVLFSIWSDLFTYDNGWRFARRFASGLGYKRENVEAALNDFTVRLSLMNEAEAIRKFNPDLKL